MTNEKVKGPASYFPSIEKTYGKPIAEWKALIRSKPGLKHMELVNWLKAEHGMGHGHANALVAHTLARGLTSPPNPLSLRGEGETTDGSTHPATFFPLTHWN